MAIDCQNANWLIGEPTPAFRDKDGGVGLLESDLEPIVAVPVVDSLDDRLGLEYVGDRQRIAQRTEAASNLEFELTADIRDRIREVREEFDLEGSDDEGIAPPIEEF